MDFDATEAPRPEGTSESPSPEKPGAAPGQEGAGKSSDTEPGGGRSGPGTLTAQETHPDEGHPFSFVIEPEPSPEEASAITAALITVLSGQRQKRRTDAEWAAIRARRAIWQAARRPRPTPHLLRGIEPSTAWKLSGLIGKPFGR